MGKTNHDITVKQCIRDDGIMAVSDEDRKTPSKSKNLMLEHKVCM